MVGYIIGWMNRDLIAIRGVMAKTTLILGNVVGFGEPGCWPMTIRTAISVSSDRHTAAMAPIAVGHRVLSWVGLMAASAWASIKRPAQRSG
jgi:hypothetical protein